MTGQFVFGVLFFLCQMGVTEQSDDLIQQIQDRVELEYKKLLEKAKNGTRRAKRRS